MKAARALTKPDCEDTPKFGMFDDGGRFEVTEWEYEFLLKALRIYKGWRGCDTPAESFIVDLITTHDVIPLSVEDVVQSLETFRLDFQDAVRTAANFAMNHTDLVRGLLPPGWELTLRNLNAATTDTRGMNRVQKREVVR